MAFLLGSCAFWRLGEDTAISASEISLNLETKIQWYLPHEMFLSPSSKNQSLSPLFYHSPLCSTLSYHPLRLTFLLLVNLFFSLEILEDWDDSVFTLVPLPAYSTILCIWQVHVKVPKWEKFSISNNCALDKPHWLWYCYCAKLKVHNWKGARSPCW